LDDTGPLVVTPERALSHRLPAIITNDTQYIVSTVIVIMMQ